MYYPTMQNIPAFQHKGQFVANYSGSFAGSDYNLGYAITDNIGLLFNAGRYSNDDAGGAYKAPAEGKYFEVGAGYFKKKNHLIYETFGFITKGDFYNGPGTFNGAAFGPLGNLNSDIFRVSVQPSVTYSRKIFEVSFSARYDFVNYYNISNTPYYFNDVDMNGFLRDNPSFHYIQPAATFRIGLKNIKFQLQLIGSVPFDHIPSTNHYQYFNAMGHVGCFVKF